MVAQGLLASPGFLSGHRLDLGDVVGENEHSVESAPVLETSTNTNSEHAAEGSYVLVFDQSIFVLLVMAVHDSSTSETGHRPQRRVRGNHTL